VDTIIHIENDKYIGRTKFFSNLLKDAISLSVKEVRGVARLGKKVFGDKAAATTKGVKIYESDGGNEFSVDIDICIEYGYTVADVSYRVQEAVINTAKQLSDKRISSVNIKICGTKVKKADNGEEHK
jgi:uncharacterized alkaline shock family protein YloU